MAGNYAQLLDIINNPTQHGLPAWDNNAKQIEGKTIQQYLLSIINSLTVGYQFIGVATPSTSPGTPDQNVFYIGGAGTYANFGTSITVRQGQICVFKWNGSWTNTPIKISNSGFVNVNDINGRASAYESASAARSAVPNEEKKLGLVITYLLADGWYIDQFIGSNISGWGTASNWWSFKIINDLVTGGVKNVLSAEQGKVLANAVYPKVRWIEGYLINGTTLIPSENVNYKYSLPIYIKACKETVINIVSTGNNVALIAKSDADGNLQSAVLTSNNSTNYQYSIQTSGYYVLCYKYLETGASITINGTPIDDYVFISETQNLEDELFNGIPNVEWEDGKAIQTSLTILSLSGYKLSNIIPVKKGDLFIVNSAGANISYVTMCQSDGTLISSLLYSVSGDSPTDNILRTVLIPNDGYVRICYKHSIGNSYAKVSRLFIQESINEINDNLSVVNSVIGYEKLNWILGYYSTDDGSKVANADYKYSEPIAVKSGDILSVNTAGANIAIINQVTSDGTFVKNILKAKSTGLPNVPIFYEQTIQEDCYVSVCYKYTIPKSYLLINSELIDKISNDINIRSLLGYNFQWITGFLRDSAGNITGNDNYAYSKPISVKAGDVISVRTGGANIGIILKVTNEGAYISTLSYTPSTAGSDDLKLYTYTIEEDCYISVCFKYKLIGSFIKINDYCCVQLERLTKSLKILVFGNSYAADSWTYVPFILKNYGIDCDITLYYRGALSLENLYNRWETADPFDVETTGLNAGTYNRQRYHIDTRTEKAWSSLSLKSAKECVEMGGWDIISMQQWSGYSIDINSYEPYFNDILQLIRASLNTPYTLLFNEVCTRPTYDNIPASLSAQEAICHKEPIEIFAPYGTAIFNARSNSILSQLGDYAGDVQEGYPAHNLWCADGVHIQEGIPKYIASLAIVQVLFNRFYNGKSVLGDITRPTDANIALWGSLEVRGNSTGVTEQNCYLAQKCAILANKYPHVVTQID